MPTFEYLIQAYKVPHEWWAFKLVPKLVGKALQAYAALKPDNSKDYAMLKKAILLCYDINEEIYWQTFRAAPRKEGETNRELSVRLQDLDDEWTQGCNAKEQLKYLIVLEYCKPPDHLMALDATVVITTRMLQNLRWNHTGLDILEYK